MLIQGGHARGYDENKRRASWRGMRGGRSSRLRTAGASWVRRRGGRNLGKGPGGLWRVAGQGPKSWEGGRGERGTTPTCQVSRCTRSNWFRLRVEAEHGNAPRIGDDHNAVLLRTGQAERCHGPDDPECLHSADGLHLAGGIRAIQLEHHAVQSCILVHLWRREITMCRAGDDRPLLSRQRVKKEAASLLLTNPQPQPAPPDPGICSRAAFPFILLPSPRGAQRETGGCDEHRGGPERSELRTWRCWSFNEQGTSATPVDCP